MSSFSKIDLSPGYRIRDQGGVYFLTYQVMFWIDIFSRQLYRDIIIESLSYCRKEKGLQVHAFVVMSNHVHLIVSAQNENLSNIIRDHKGFTSRKILETIETSGRESRKGWLMNMFRYAGRDYEGNASGYRFWTGENHPVQLNDLGMTHQRLNYIHENPVRAGLVARPEEWVYSSASNYAGLGGILEVDFI